MRPWFFEPGAEDDFAEALAFYREESEVADDRTACVPAVHKKIVAARLADYQSGKSVPVPHAELMRKLRAK